MEQRANEVFSRYAKMYYDDNFYTSVYFFDTGVDSGFGSCWLIKKIRGEGDGIEQGVWDATHVVTTNVDNAKNSAKYRVNSTVFFQLDATNEASFGTLDCGCTAMKVKEDYLNIDAKSQADISQFHLRNIGKLIEANEGELRSDLHGNYINKTKLIINTGRYGYGY